MNTADVISRAEVVLNDAANVRWTEAELLLWIADAQQNLIQNVPDAASTTQVIQLAANNTIQSVPDAYSRLLRLTRNMGAGGAQAGDVIVPARFEDMNAIEREWHGERGRTIEHYIYDPEVDRRRFYVYPAPSTTIHVEGVFVRRTSLTLGSGATLIVGDQWINPIVDWVLFRAFDKNWDTGDQARAQRYAAQFYQHVGVEYQVRPTVDPNRDIRAGAG